MFKRLALPALASALVLATAAFSFASADETWREPDGTTHETTISPDGTTTHETITSPDGTTIHETITSPDGTKKIDHKKVHNEQGGDTTTILIRNTDGSWSQTTINVKDGKTETSTVSTDKNGKRTEEKLEKTDKDGTKTTQVRDKDGNTTTTVIDKDGKQISKDTRSADGTRTTHEESKGWYKVTPKGDGLIVDWGVPSGAAGMVQQYPKGTTFKPADPSLTGFPFVPIYPKTADGAQHTPSAKGSDVIGSKAPKHKPHLAAQEHARLNAEHYSSRAKRSRGDVSSRASHGKTRENLVSRSRTNPAVRPLVRNRHPIVRRPSHSMHNIRRGYRLYIVRQSQARRSPAWSHLQRRPGGGGRRR